MCLVAALSSDDDAENPCGSQEIKKKGAVVEENPSVTQREQNNDRQEPGNITSNTRPDESLIIYKKFKEPNPNFNPTCRIFLKYPLREPWGNNPLRVATVIATTDYGELNPDFRVLKRATLVRDSTYPAAYFDAQTSASFRGEKKIVYERLYVMPARHAHLYQSCRAEPADFEKLTDEFRQIFDSIRESRDRFQE